MRVITGEARGRTLQAPEGFHTRPTSEKVKEALFSIIQFELEGRRVLDLFAGSGQLGIEALSRGARECVFVENDRNALQIIKRNIEHCGFGDRSKVVAGDAAAFVKRGEKFDIVFADPPYEGGARAKTLEAISTFDTLNFGGIMIVESAKDDILPDLAALEKGREYLYGQTKLTLYRRSAT